MKKFFEHQIEFSEIYLVILYIYLIKSAALAVDTDHMKIYRVEKS